MRSMQVSDLLIVVLVWRSGSGAFGDDLHYVENSDDDVKRSTESAVVCFC